jgi:hypothetical protein
MASAAPTLCLGCGHDLPSLPKGEGPHACARCGTSRRAVQATKTGEKPPRFELRDDTGGVATVTLRGSAVAEASGHHPFRVVVRSKDLPTDLLRLSSERVVPYPFEIEAAPHPEEVVDGAFVCAMLSITRFGLIELAYDEVRAWKRHSTFVVPIDAHEVGTATLHVRRATGSSPSLPPLERAIVAASERSVRAHGYRDRVAEWQSLAQLSSGSASELPSARAIVTAARLAGFEDEMLLEDLERAAPRLVHGLVAAARAIYRRP